MGQFFHQGRGAVFMQFIGMFIDFFPHEGRSYPSYVYRLAFLACPLSMVASLVFYAFSKPSSSQKVSINCCYIGSAPLQKTSFSAREWAESLSRSDCMECCTVLPVRVNQPKST
jgi:hypothetical protein